MATRPLLDNLVFPEGPRWRDGKLWFSDMYGGRVLTVDLDGRSELVAEVPQRPSGLGWLPDGRLLIVSMLDRKLLRLDPDGLTTHADLSGLAGGNTNDMVVDPAGRAWIGNFGATAADGTRAPAQIVLVDPDGSARVVADGMLFPNGSVITPDGATLIVAETRGARLTAFSIQEDGSLANRRVWADISPAGPDGICLDAEGAVWVGTYTGGEFLRVREGGEVLERIPTPGRNAVACALGGPDRRTLFLLTAVGNLAGEVSQIKGWIEVTEVDVPGAGWP